MVGVYVVISIRANIFDIANAILINIGVSSGTIAVVIIFIINRAFILIIAIGVGYGNAVVAGIGNSILVGVYVVISIRANIFGITNSILIGVGVSSCTIAVVVIFIINRAFILIIAIGVGYSNAVVARIWNSIVVYVNVIISISANIIGIANACLLYTSPSPRDS